MGEWEQYQGTTAPVMALPLERIGLRRGLVLGEEAQALEIILRPPSCIKDALKRFSCQCIASLVVVDDCDSAIRVTINPPSGPCFPF